jgi:hypothetical protein
VHALASCACRYQNLTDAEEAKKLRDARRFAKGLFYNVRSEVRPYVIRDDFTPFFGSKDSADAAFAYFDKVRNTRRFSARSGVRDGPPPTACVVPFLVVSLLGLV